MRSAELEQSQGGSTYDFEQLRSRCSSCSAPRHGKRWPLVYGISGIAYIALPCLVRRTARATSTPRAIFVSRSRLDAELFVCLRDRPLSQAFRTRDMNRGFFPKFANLTNSCVVLSASGTDTVLSSSQSRPMDGSLSEADNLPVSVNVSPPPSKNGKAVMNLMMSDSPCQYRTIKKKINGETGFAARNVESSTLHV